MRNFIFFLLTIFILHLQSYAQNNCLKCHKGIESIRDPNSEMMKEINEIAEKAGFAGNSCIVCHGG
ncbi:hypothetical protein HG1285_09606, partial [Hydrogenivirga sp. 128-5-R1-1]